MFSEDKAKRIFIAVPISNPLQNEIAVWEKKYTESGSVRWLAGKNLHVTLIPPWYEYNLEEVFALLDSIRGKLYACEIEFRKVSYGPQAHEPCLIWAEGEAPALLEALKEELERIFGRKSEYIHWKMHLTLARFRLETFSSFPKKILDEKVSWYEKVSSIVLMESHVSSEGADYEILRTIQLGS